MDITARRMGETAPMMARRAPRPKAGANLPPLRAPKLLDQLRERIRYLHYSRRTEQAYVHWARAFIRFHGLRHPAEMGAAEVETFLQWLAAERDVAPSTHNQALSAILFLYTKVLGLDLPWLSSIGRPAVRRRFPMMLTPDDVAAVLQGLEGEHRLLACLLYDTGLRLQRAFKRAGAAAGITQPATPHTLRHLLRHPSAASRVRHPHRAGIARALRRRHHDDLHPCAPSVRRRRAFASGFIGHPATGVCMNLDTDRIDDAVLALLLLGLHDGQRAWKSFDWDAMSRLHERGLISDPRGRAKSVVLTDEGLREAQQLLLALFARRG